MVGVNEPGLALGQGVEGPAGTHRGMSPARMPSAFAAGDGPIERMVRMAARRKKAKKKARRGGKSAELIISKARTKKATRKCNVGSEFYGALDAAVRDMIKGAEARAIGNKRKTLKAVDL